MNRFIMLSILTLLFYSLNMDAQDSNKKTSFFKTVKFSSLQQVGIVGNEVQTVPTFQLIAGAQYRRLFIGAGASIDSYYMYSFPLFADVRYTFYKKQIQSFVFGDLGINKLFNSDNRLPRKWSNGETAYTVHNGLYYEYGIGLKTKLSNNLWYTCSVGISFKETKYTYSYITWQNNTPYTELYKNVASRFAVRMGVQF